MTKFYFDILFLVLATAIVAQNTKSNDEIVSATVTQPRKVAEAFWSKENLLAAEEFTPEITIDFSSNHKSLTDLPRDLPMFIENTKDDDKNQISDSRSATNLYNATNGRVFWSCPNSGSYSCSASVIVSSTRNVILTAAHCVFDTRTRQWFLNCNWIFIPGYSNGSAPYGKWTAKRFFSFNAYTQYPHDFNYDVAFVNLNTLTGYQISQKIPSQPIGFNFPYGRFSYSFGYPGNLENGQMLQSCASTPFRVNFTINGVIYRGQGLPYCAMGPGCSGGQWVQSRNSFDQTYAAYSVNSFKSNSYPSTIFGPIFNSLVYQAWTAAQSS